MSSTWWEGIVQFVCSWWWLLLLIVILALLLFTFPLWLL